MKRFVVFSFCLFILLVLNYLPMQAQWFQTNGPYATSVSSFAVNGTNLFAGTDDGGGVFFSTNNGMSGSANDIYQDC